MKKILTLILIASQTLLAKELSTSSRISEVTVFSDRARVTRETEVQIPPGTSEVIFTGLPENLDESSVQAQGEGQDSLKIIGLEIRNQFLEKAADAEVQKLKDSLQSIEDQLLKLEDEVHDLADRRNFLLKLQDNMTQDLGKEVKTNQAKPEQLKGIYDFYGNELKTLTQRFRAIDEEKRSFQPKRNKIQEEINRLMAGTTTRQKTVRVAVQGNKETSAMLKISYVMPGASWQPLYDARAHILKSNLDLTCYGVVRQQTGENWDNVKLSLSTARPNIHGHPEELQPWWLTFFRPAPVAYKSEKKLQFFSSMEAEAVAKDQNGTHLSVSDKPASVAITQETARLDSHGISAVYHIQMPTTIPSDGEPHQSPISTQTLKGNFNYLTTPKLIEAAFLKAHMTNENEAPLLSGEVNLFLEDDFIGKSFLPFIASSADFDFFFGVDEGIKVNRKQLVNRQESGGIFTLKKKKVLVQKYEITVENFKPNTQAVTLFDQIPVSQSEEIEVTGVQYSEQPQSVDKESGKITWNLNLKPRESRKITLEFQISIPQDQNLAGL